MYFPQVLIQYGRRLCPLHFTWLRLFWCVSLSGTMTQLDGTLLVNGQLPSAVWCLVCAEFLSIFSFIWEKELFLCVNDMNFRGDTVCHWKLESLLFCYLTQIDSQTHWHLNTYFPYGFIAMGCIILCLVNHDLFDLYSRRPVAWQVIFVVHIHQSCPWTPYALSSGNYYTITGLMKTFIFLWPTLSLTLALTRFLPSSLTTGYRHVYLEGLTEASIFVHVSVHDVYGKVSAV